MHKKELKKLKRKRDEQHLTLVPVAMYWVGNHIKVEVGLAKGKKLYDKRQDIAKKDMQRNMERQMKN